MNELLELFLTSVRDGYVQVSATNALTVLLFSYAQYRTAGALVDRLRENERAQPLADVYAEGAIPFSALTANAISQDGDALFPCSRSTRPRPWSRPST